MKTGALLGFYAGQDYLDSQLNWAALGGAPGSAFKPFALAAGLKAGFSLKDTFDGNSPYTFEDGSEVVNEGEGGGTNYGSAISLLKATEDSVNTAYADLTDSLPNGPQKILNTAVSMGIPRNTPGLEPNDAIALGSATLSPITMANAYATIANGGVHHDLFMVKKVSRSSDGKVLYRAPRKKNRVLPDDIDRDVSYALQQVVKSGTGQNAQALGRPAAGKTGTATNDDGDVSSSWFVGYTPQVVDGRDVRARQGQRGAQRLPAELLRRRLPDPHLAAVMQAVLEGTDPEDFPPAAFVDGDAPDDGPRAVHAAAEADQEGEAQANKPKPPTPHAGASPTQPAPPSQPGNAGGNGGGNGGGNPDPRRAVRSDGPHLHPVNARGTPRAPASPTGRRRADPGGPVRPLDERGGRRPGRLGTPVRTAGGRRSGCCSPCSRWSSRSRLVQHEPCLQTNWASDQARYAKACYSDIPYLYTGRGFAEGLWPYADTDGRYQVMEYPVGISYLAWAAAKITQLDPSGPPVARAARTSTPDALWSLPGMAKEVNTYFLVTALLLCAVRAARDLVHGRGPPAAALGRDAVRAVARLLLTGLINWDLMAVAFVAGALWAWARGRPVLTGVMIGLGAATKLYPLFLLGAILVVAWRRASTRCLRRRPPALRWRAGRWSTLPAWLTGFEQWKVFWRFNSERGADLGSVWLVADPRTGTRSPPHTINPWSWAALRRGLRWRWPCSGCAPRGPRGWPSSASWWWPGS